MAAEDWLFGDIGDPYEDDYWGGSQWELRPLHLWINEQNAKVDRDIKLASNRLLRRLRHGRLNYPNKGAMKVS